MKQHRWLFQIILAHSFSKIELAHEMFQMARMRKDTERLFIKFCSL